MRTTIGFLATFLAGWFTLDRLVPTSMLPVPALIALGGALVVLAIGEVAVFRTDLASLAGSFGFRRPAARGLFAATAVSLAVLAAYALGASALGVRLTLDPQWPALVVGVLVFHGLAEELVWRTFAFRHLRDGRSFRRAVLLSMPLIALTHLPIIFGNGPLVGGLAMVSAAVTCLPLAYLWERGGRTIWAPALLHATIDLWQVLTPGYPMTFSMVVLLVSILVPLLAFAFRDRFFGATLDGAAQPTAPRLAAATA